MTQRFAGDLSSTTPSPSERLVVVVGAVVAVVAALALSISIAVECLAEEIVVAAAAIPESAGPEFRSAPEKEQIELLRKLLGVPAAKPAAPAPPAEVAPVVVPAPQPAEPETASIRTSPPYPIPEREAPRRPRVVQPKKLQQKPQEQPEAGPAKETPHAETPASVVEPMAVKAPAMLRFDEELAVSSSDLPAPGTRIDGNNAERWKHLLVPSIRWAVRRGVPVDVSQAKPIVMEPARAEATERYHAQVALGPDRKSLRNYVAGIPFPYVTADDADAAIKLIFNAEKRILFDDVDGRNFGCKTGKLDTATGLHTERDYRAGHFRRLYYSGRLVVDPKPVWENVEGIHYRESISPFSEPFDYKGAGVTYNRYTDSSRSDDSWLYYPQSRRVRRLGAAQRSDGIFGLDIDLDSYGGFAGNPAWFDWEVLGKKTLLSPFHAKHEPMQWAAKPGDFLFDDQWEARETWMLAARSRIPGYNFSLRVVYVDAQSMLMPYSEVYDKSGQLWRAYVQQWKAGVDRSMPYSPRPTFRSPTAIVAGLSVFDMQQEHATVCEIPAADAPREEAWHLYESADGGSVPEDFDLASFITAGR